MIETLAGLLAPVQGALAGVILVFLRVGAVVGLMPVFGETSVPMRVRIGLALAFSAVVAPAVLADTGPHPALLPPLGAAAAEVATGVFFGLGIRFFVLALQTAGTIAAQSASLSQIFGGSAGAEPQPAIGHVLTIGGLALAAGLGLHVQAAAYLVQSYALVPLGTAPLPGTVAEAGVAEVGRAFARAFALAAPFVVAALIYNVTLGVINKAMPQLMVSFVGAPALTAGGLILLFLTAPLILGAWQEGLSAFLADPFGARP